MNERHVSWTVTALVAAVAVLTTLLVVGMFRQEPRLAFAQPESVASGYVVGILGQTNGDATPLFVVDTKTQNIMIYEYLTSRRTMFLRATRSFEYDRQLQEGYFGQDIYRGPSVRDIQGLLRQQQTGAPAGGGGQQY